MRRNPMMRILRQVSNLTPDQRAQIRGVMENTRSQVEALRNDSSLSREDRRGKIGAIMQGTQAQVRAILTPDQQRQFDAAIAAMRQNAGGEPAEAPPPPPPPSS